MSISTLPSLQIQYPTTSPQPPKADGGDDNERKKENEEESDHEHDAGQSPFLTEIGVGG